MAKGKACGTITKAIHQKNCASTSIVRPLPTSSSTERHKRKPFSYQVVDILPQELHHQHKKADEERSEKQHPELLTDKYV